MTYSGFFRRLFAYTIDCFVLVALYVFMGLFLGFSFIFHPLTTLPMVGFWFYGGIFMLGWLYFASMESCKWQATVGKKLLGIKVVGKNGEKIGFIRGSVRFYSKILSRILFMFGFIMILFTKKKQALHDKIASTLIIRN